MKEKKIEVGICSQTKAPATPNFCKNLCKVRHENNNCDCVLWGIKEYDTKSFDDVTLKKISTFCHKTYLNLMLSGQMPNTDELNNINQMVVKCLRKHK